MSQSTPFVSGGVAVVAKQLPLTEREPNARGDARLNVRYLVLWGGYPPLGSRFLEPCPVNTLQACFMPTRRWERGRRTDLSGTPTAETTRYYGEPTVPHRAFSQYETQRGSCWGEGLPRCGMREDVRQPHQQDLYQAPRGRRQARAQAGGDSVSDRPRHFGRERVNTTRSGDVVSY